MTAARLGSLLANAPAGPLVFADGAWTTQAEMHESARALGSALRSVGVADGTPVGTLLPNSAVGLAAMFGVWEAGGVVVPLNPRVTARECAQVLDQVGTTTVVMERSDAARFAPVLGGRSVVEYLDGQWRTTAASAHSTGGQGFDRDVALVLFTSGTTGPPKPVLLRHASVLAALDAVLERLGARAPAPGATRMPNVIPVPISLWSGIYNICFSLRVGAPVLLIDHFEPAEFVRLVKAFDIRSSVLAPAMLTMLLDDPAVEDLVPLRIVRSISAPLSPHEARRFHDRFGVVVLNGYGQTELGGEVIGWSAKDSREFGDQKLGSVGRPHPGVGVRIVADDGTDAAPGDLGEICVRSPFVMAGYVDAAPRDGAPADDDNADNAGSDRFVDDFLRTGDLGRIDDDGFVWIEGRRSDVINRGGMKVQPGEVEEVLRGCSGVADVAVAGVPDARLGEVPVAFVVLGASESGDPSAVLAALRERARAQLAPYKVPVSIVVVDALPRNDMGKVVRRELVAAGEWDQHR